MQFLQMLSHLLQAIYVRKGWDLVSYSNPWRVNGSSLAVKKRAKQPQIQEGEKETIPPDW